MSYLFFVSVGTVILLGFFIVFAFGEKKKIAINLRVSWLAIYGGMVYLLLCTTSFIFDIINWFTH
ncbi:TPA: hypothetical protein ACSKR0_002863 [Listeria monocytogenes]